VIVVGVYVGAQMLADVASLKVAVILGLAVNMGLFLYAFTFTLRDLVHKSLGRKGTRLVILVGLGKQKDFELDIVRQVSAKAACTARELGAKRLGFCADSVIDIDKGVDLKRAARLLTAGALLGLLVLA
jgi:hypothetical protein